MGEQARIAQLESDVARLESVVSTLKGEIVSRLNLNMGGNVEITERGLISRATDNSSVEIQNGVVIFRSPSGCAVTVIDTNGINHIKPKENE